MFAFLPTIILRHRKENLKKCSLRGLESREDLSFYTYPNHFPPDLEQYVTLHFDGELLSEKDQKKGLFLLDSTWKYEETMHTYAKKHASLVYRSLPSHFKTAYPRAQTHCHEPTRGLATVEALYIAYKILKRPTEGILDNYHWKEQFLLLNAESFALLE